MNYKDFRFKLRYLVEYTADKIEQRVYIGGYVGGNCWNNTESYWESVDVSSKDREFSSLHEVLEEVCPDIKLSDYRKVLEHVQTERVSKPEYYGNSSVYEIQSIGAKRLYDILHERGVI